MSLTLSNPHSLWAALNQRPQAVEEIQVPDSLSPVSEKELWNRIRRRADQLGLLKKALSPSPKGTPSAWGRLRPKEAIPFSALFSSLAELQPPGVWLACDRIQDPHNLGALFRSAAFFGVRGVILTKHQTAPLSAVAYDVSCGGIEHVPFSLQTNLQPVFEWAKAQGCWILGTSEHVSLSYRQVSQDRPWILVVGNEGEGLRPLVEKACDVVCRIPAQGPVASLNVSVASGVLLSHLLTEPAQTSHVPSSPH